MRDKNSGVLRYNLQLHSRILLLVFINSSNQPYSLFLEQSQLQPLLSTEWRENLYCWQAIDVLSPYFRNKGLLNHQHQQQQRYLGSQCPCFKPFRDQGDNEDWKDSIRYATKQCILLF
ncbi:hypothetical protein BCR33DRAFT_720915 [Rhizoclosmatium globosum]|uniref:Uncharacterized protein n=1 Tax=Rhizoclosmatium globosum TaxID=329046 RepID=A0A1Y2B079_9FUNG|nr:hypothetical protein BCR33DRAFT_726264 [Rhizoclosmatium globosum]ORY28248.1 hypothetical protein BCR33DRAFT_725178 [Rhizoclosmatium globosum]ORY38209.1 hypothetical protein BCR33DRAFT_720915 [Rhizoclosmatium globosum]|eukprot:ORY26397.1 hypothetical protein BCR33DRAFT_726264 [Rhizoclosmatium globosum]